MAGCCGCGSGRCTCAVVAGPGIEITGNGGSASPYVISATGGGGGDPTALQVTDTPTVDLTLSGTGGPGDPYDVAAAVRLDPAPPAGANLIQETPDGLYVDCGGVRSCLTGGPGVDYDQVTGEISVEVSAQAGNQLAVEPDGLYVPASAGGVTELQVTDTASVDLTLTGSGAGGDPYDVSAAVRLDATPPGGGGNLIHEGPDGLYVECGDVRGCLSGGDGIDVDAATGVISIDLSEQVGNAATIAGDGGLFVSAGAVSCDDVRPCLSAGDGIDYNPATGEIAAQLSTDADNQVVFGTDGGIYVPVGGGATVVVGDTDTIDMSGDGSGGNPVRGDVRIDGAAAGNLLVAGPGGLSAAVTPGCGLDGEGTPGAPLIVAVSGTWPLTDRIGQQFPCDDTNTTSEIYCAADGTLHSRPEGTTVVGFRDLNETPGVALNAGQTRTFVADFTFVNLSQCRYMHLIAASRMFWDLAITPGTEWRVYGTLLDAVAPAPLGEVLYGDLHDGTTTRRWGASFPQVGHTLNIPPGTVINYEVRLDVECISGSLTVFEQRVQARWHGTTI